MPRPNEYDSPPPLYNSSSPIYDSPSSYDSPPPYDLYSPDDSYDYLELEIDDFEYLKDKKDKLEDVQWFVTHSPSTATNFDGSELDLTEEIFKGPVFLILCNRPETRV